MGGAAGDACLGAGAGVVGLLSGAVAVGETPPALHCSTYALSVTPRACIPALSALHSAMQSFAVFCEDDVLVDADGATGAGGVATVGFGGAAEAAGAEPPLHCSTYAFSVTLRACMPTLSARHSAVQSFAVLEPMAVADRGAVCGAVSAGLAAGAADVGSAPPLH